MNRKTFRFRWTLATNIFDHIMIEIRWVEQALQVHTIRTRRSHGCTLTRFNPLADLFGKKKLCNSRMIVVAALYTQYSWYSVWYRFESCSMLIPNSKSSIVRERWKKKTHIKSVCPCVSTFYERGIRYKIHSMCRFYRCAPMFLLHPWLILQIIQFCNIACIR